MTFTSFGCWPVCLIIFVIASFAFSASFSSFRLSIWLSVVSRVLSTSTCLFLARLRASVLAWDVGSCLLKASAYMGLVPFVFARFSSWFSILVVVVCISFIILLMSLLTFSSTDDSSLQVQSVA